MPTPKRKVNLTCHSTLGSKVYTVSKLVNSLEPTIGSRLSESEVEWLIASGDYEVTITPSKK